MKPPPVAAGWMLTSLPISLAIIGVGVGVTASRGNARINLNPIGPTDASDNTGYFRLDGNRGQSSGNAVPTVLPSTLPSIQTFAHLNRLAVASSFNTWQSVCDDGHTEVVMFERFVNNTCDNPTDVQDPAPLIPGDNSSTYMLLRYFLPPDDVCTAFRPQYCTPVVITVHTWRSITCNVSESLLPRLQLRGAAPSDGGTRPVLATSTFVSHVSKVEAGQPLVQLGWFFYLDQLTAETMTEMAGIGQIAIGFESTTTTYGTGGCTDLPVVVWVGSVPLNATVTATATPATFIDVVGVTGEIANPTRVVDSGLSPDDPIARLHPGNRTATVVLEAYNLADFTRCFNTTAHLPTMMTAASQPGKLTLRYPGMVDGNVVNTTTCPPGEDPTDGGALFPAREFNDSQCDGVGFVDGDSHTHAQRATMYACPAPATATQTASPSHAPTDSSASSPSSAPVTQTTSSPTPASTVQPTARTTSAVGVSSASTSAATSSITSTGTAVTAQPDPATRVTTPRPRTTNHQPISPHTGRPGHDPHFTTPHSTAIITTASPGTGGGTSSKPRPSAGTSSSGPSSLSPNVAATTTATTIVSPTVSPTVSPGGSASGQSSSGPDVLTYVLYGVAAAAVLIAVAVMVAGRPGVRSRASTSRMSRLTNDSDDIELKDIKVKPPRHQKRALSKGAAKCNSSAKPGKGAGKRSSSARSAAGSSRSKRNPIGDKFLACTKSGAQSAFRRLECVGDVMQNQLAMARIEERIYAGVDAEQKVQQCRPCFLVARCDASVSKAKFQVQAGFVRLMAQKTIYYAYHKCTSPKLGSGQVVQSCLYPDDNWWCLEPSHLKRCKGARIAPHAVVKHPIPGRPNAVLPLLRQKAKQKAKQRQQQEEYAHAQSGTDSVTLPGPDTSAAVLQFPPPAGAPGAVGWTGSAPPPGLIPMDILADLGDIGDFNFTAQGGLARHEGAPPPPLELPDTLAPMLTPAGAALSGRTSGLLHETVFSSLADQHHRPLDSSILGDLIGLDASYYDSSSSHRSESGSLWPDPAMFMTATGRAAKEE